ncbi:MAG: OmpA family protein [Nitrospirales bacterium]
MYVTRKNSLFLCVILGANLSACGSMVTHQYSNEPQAEVTDTPYLALDPTIDVEIDQSTVEELQEEPIVPMESTIARPMLTPASFYHSPDPPVDIPEYVPSLFFDFDSWLLTNKGKHILELTAAQLIDDQESTLIIEGHCDDRGAEGYNLVLGDKRALTIQDYLVSLGVDKTRITTVSFGDTHPVCFENNETCHALNRRGYLVLLKSD